MGEIKSVKVDNWGVFFLQKLQNFFNKTDYCDLTLQFKDNSQLKVHRLVLSACTDYFNVLEQTCDVVDDALIMPNELQADVVVPIVNFMYTGTLEFELKMYGKLLRTAKEMNMTVLLKLLEAHRRTMEGVNRAQRPASPKVRRRNPNIGMPAATLGVGQTRLVAPSSPKQQTQARRILTTANSPQTQQGRIVQNRTITTNVGLTQSQLPMQVRQQIGSTSLIKTSPNKGQRTIFETTYMPDGSNTTYETVELKQEQNDDYEQPMLQSSSLVNQSTSPFEQLRKGYNNNKRPASATFISPPTKKPNIEDVKEFSEQQRMRKQIAAEYGDDNEYEGMLDDDIHNDDDDDDAGVPTSSTSAASIQTISRQQQQQNQQGPSIIIKQEPNEKPTIVVKDSANSKMNHAKIISEVLRQYPHLVKSNKNIKLKIMPNVGGQPQKIILKKEQLDSITADMGSSVAQSSGATSEISSANVSTQSHTAAQQQKQQSIIKQTERSILLQQQQLATANLPSAQESPPAQSVSGTSITNTGTAVTAPTTSVSAATANIQKRRIDSKTMHALIAQGAENTTGPWLCLRCGVNGRPISIPSYRGFRRHLINTHKETIDPALCEHCGWRSTNNRSLHFHTQLEHKIMSSLYTFPECLMCSEIVLDTNALNQHMMENHSEENRQQCIYCNKIFSKEMQLYTHMKTYHKKQAIEDGIIDYSDDEGADVPMEAQDEFIDEDVVVEKRVITQSISRDKKIKILSDISLPSANSLMKLEPSSEAAALTTIASGIAASIGLSETSEEFINTSVEDATAASVSKEVVGEPKFVTADGNEMVLTEEQRKEIMSQLNQEHEGGVVMVLNEPAEFTSVVTHTNIEETTASHGEEGDAAEENIAGAESEDNVGNSANEEDDDSNIYSEFVGGAEARKAQVLDESKGSVDNLEWAENLISAQELEDETASSKKKDLKNMEDNSKGAKTGECISKKLQELTEDWSDDDDDQYQELVSKTNKEEESLTESSDIKAMETSADHEEDEKQDEGTKNLLEEAEENPAEETDKPVEENNQTEKKLDVPETSAAAVDSDKEGDEHEEDDIDIALKGLHTDIAEGDTDTKHEDSTAAEENVEKDKATEDDQIVDDISKANDESENEGKDIKEGEIEAEPVAAMEKEDDTFAARVKKDDNKEIPFKKDAYKTEASANSSAVIDINREMKKSLLDELIHDDDEDDDQSHDEKDKGNVQTIDAEKSESQTNERDSKAPVEDVDNNEEDTEASTSTSKLKEPALKEKSISSTVGDLSSTKSSEEEVKALISEWDEGDEEEVK